LDAASETVVVEALERLTQGRSVLIVAHRLSTIRRATRIVVLQEGRMAESGTHDELLRRGGVHAGFYRLQFGAA
jgi:ATP-binding cassette subfamily B protein/subfamily B ATP-binding cassette protein MsbA